MIIPWFYGVAKLPLWYFIDWSLFSTVLLRDVLLLITVPYVSLIKKLPVPCRNFGLGLVMSLLRQRNHKIRFLHLSAKPGDGTNIVFHEEFLKQYFQLNLIRVWCHTIMNDGLWLVLTIKTGRWKCMKATFKAREIAKWEIKFLRKTDNIVMWFKNELKKLEVSEVARTPYMFKL